jgi:hypothetical protein
VLDACFQQIPRSDDRVHEGIGKGLFASSGGQVKNEGNILRCCVAVLTGQEIACDYFYVPATSTARKAVNASRRTRRSCETPKIPKAAIQ